MNFNARVFVDAWPALMDGLKITMIASTAGMAVALALGLSIAIAGRNARRVGALLIESLVTIVRSTPLLIQLYLLFYVLPLYGPRLSPLATGIIGLGVHYASYLSEVFRAGIDSVPKGQWEATVALHLNRRTTWTRIILPQVVRTVLPQVGNYFISIYKAAALLATITVVDLLGAGLNYAGETFRYFEIFTLIGIIYFIIGFLLSRFVQYAERRLA